MMADLIDASQLRSLIVALETDAHEAAVKAGEIVAASIHKIEAGGKRRAPVDTGALRNSIGSDYLGYQDGIVAAEAGPTVNYAPFVELGTSRMAPQPHMGPAFDEEAPRFEAAIAALADPAGLT